MANGGLLLSMNGPMLLKYVRVVISKKPVPALNMEIEARFRVLGTNSPDLQVLAKHKLIIQFI
jgi:hypothetical protein